MILAPHKNPAPRSFGNLAVASSWPYELVLADTQMYVFARSSKSQGRSKQDRTTLLKKARQDDVVVTNELETLAKTREDKLLTSLISLHVEIR